MIIQAELRRKQSEYEGEACVIDKVIELPAPRFEQFSHALLADYDFIAENKNAIQHNDNARHCLLIRCFKLSWNPARQKAAAILTRTGSSNTALRLCTESYFHIGGKTNAQKKDILSTHHDGGVCLAAVRPRLRQRGCRRCGREHVVDCFPADKNRCGQCHLPRHRPHSRRIFLCQTGNGVFRFPEDRTV